MTLAEEIAITNDEIPMRKKISEHYQLIDRFSLDRIGRPFSPARILMIDLDDKF